MTHCGTVFVVEDDREFTSLLRLRFEMAGHRVLTTQSGVDAYELIQSARPDVVILDIFLPDMDGLTILKRLKSPINIETGRPSSTKNIPVVILTGKAPMIENMARGEGACDFFLKPVEMDKLLNRISQLVEIKKHGHESKSQSDPFGR